jgi:hypothetical protein
MFKSVRFAVLAVGSSLVALPAAAQDSPVLGGWDTEIVIQGNTNLARLNIAQDGDGYTAEIVRRDGDTTSNVPASTITDVVVDGASFSFKRNVTGGQGATLFTYEGSVDGDSLTADVTSQMGDFTLSGTRVE